MIQVRTATLASIATELDAAMDALSPGHPAFPALTQARALYNIHILHRLPLAELFPVDPGQTPESGYETDAAGTFVGKGH